jgi:hypothetical protein
METSSFNFTSWMCRGMYMHATIKGKRLRYDERKLLEERNQI